MSAWRRWLSLALLGGLLLACSSGPTPQLAAPMLPVASFGTLARSELLSLQVGEQFVAFTARLESDGQTLRVVAITPTGQRLFSLTRRDDQLIAEPGPLWPQAVPLELVWADFEMAHAPSTALLSAHWQRQTVAGVETWRYRGQTLATITHEAGKTRLERPQYQLSIEVLPE